MNDRGLILADIAPADLGPLLTDTLPRDLKALEQLADQAGARGDIRAQARCLKKLIKLAQHARGWPHLSRYCIALEDCAIRARHRGLIKRGATQEENERWEDFEMRCLEVLMDIRMKVFPDKEPPPVRKSKKKPEKNAKMAAPVLKRDWSQVSDDDLEKEMGDK